MTALAQLVGRDVTVDEALPLVVRHFGDVFGVGMQNSIALGSTEGGDTCIQKITNRKY